MIPELTLAKVWQAQWFVPGPWRTTDGRALVVRYRGRWSAGFGPDFADAHIVLGVQECTGAVEIHRRAADWRAHGHHLDPAYNAVRLYSEKFARFSVSSGIFASISYHGA
jgi:hypothetical protein